MTLERTTEAQAAEFCAHVVAREPWRLRDLAARMRATGGPVESMDGSYGSLVPLWRWFVGYADAGFPGVTDQEVPSAWPTRVGFGDDTPQTRRDIDLSRRAQVASEAVSHYVRLVLERETGAARWRVYVDPDGRNLMHHATVVRDRDGRVHDVALAGQAKAVASGRPTVCRERFLVDRFSPDGGAGDADGRPLGSSILTPYLDLDPAGIPVEALVSPVVRWSREWWPPESPDRRRARAAASAPPAPAGRIGEDMTLAAGPVAGLDDPALLRPLDADRAARLLAAAGFLGSDGAPTARHLTEDTELVHVDEAARIETLTHDGTLRALHVEPIDPDEQTWLIITTALGHLAAASGARFLPDHELAD